MASLTLADLAGRTVPSSGERNPSVRARGNLGLRFEKGGDLHKKKSRDWYGSK